VSRSRRQRGLSSRRYFAVSDIHTLSFIQLMNPIVDITEYDAASFGDWTGLIPSQSVAVALTIFGDWIYSHENTIYMFSPTSATSFEIATVVEEIEWACENIHERAPWLHPELLTALDTAGVTRESGKIFHFVTPLFLGGKIELGNVQQLSIRDYFTGMLKLLRQISE
jgi:hypothetical protein